MPTPSPDPCRRPGRAGLIAPWILAPAWVFLPLMGCGLAEVALKPSPAPRFVGDRPESAPAAGASAAGVSLVPVGSTVTVAAAPFGSR